MSALQKINVCKYPSIGRMLISKDGFIITSSFHTSSSFFFFFTPLIWECLFVEHTRGVTEHCVTVTEP